MLPLYFLLARFILYNFFFWYNVKQQSCRHSLEKFLCIHYPELSTAHIKKKIFFKSIKKTSVPENSLPGRAQTSLTRCKDSALIPGTAWGHHGGTALGKQMVEPCCRQSVLDFYSILFYFTLFIVLTRNFSPLSYGGAED